MENNIDEFYSLDCQECGYHLMWEPNYYGSLEGMKVQSSYRNNIIVFGAYMKHLDKSFRYEDDGTVPSDEDLQNYFSRKSVYVVDAPPKPLSKVEFMDYIAGKIQKSI